MILWHSEKIVNEEKKILKSNFMYLKGTEILFDNKGQII